MSYCGGFTVLTISAELVGRKDTFRYLREEKKGGHHSAAGMMRDITVEMRHLHRVSRTDLGEGMLKKSGLTIMVSEDIYFSSFRSRLVKPGACEAMEGHGNLVPAIQ